MVNWVGGSGNFSDSSQWYQSGVNNGNPPSAPPGSGDTALFNAGGTVTIDAGVTNLAAQINVPLTVQLDHANYTLTGITGDIYGLEFDINTVPSGGYDGNLDPTGIGTLSTYGIMGLPGTLSIGGGAVFDDSVPAQLGLRDITPGGEFDAPGLTIVDASIANGTIAADNGTGGGAGAITLDAGTLLATSLDLFDTGLTGFGTVGDPMAIGATLNTAPQAVLFASGGTLEIDAEVINGNPTIDTTSMLALPDPVDGGNGVVFAGPRAGLDLDTPSLFDGSISGFGQADSIDLGVGMSISAYARTAMGGTLTLGLTDGTTANLMFSGSYGLSSFRIQPGLGTGAVVTFVACFAAGTRIRTRRGDVPVQHLRVGDDAVTADGPMRPIRWLGSRRMNIQRHPDPRSVTPVRIAATPSARDSRSGRCDGRRTTRSTCTTCWSRCAIWSMEAASRPSRPTRSNTGTSNSTSTRCFWPKDCLAKATWTPATGSRSSTVDR